MLPTLIHPVLASLGGIAFTSTYPIAITVVAFGNFVATRSEYGINIRESAAILGVWFVSYAVTGEYFLRGIYRVHFNNLN